MARSRINGNGTGGSRHAGRVTATAATLLALCVTGALTLSASVGLSANAPSDDDEACLACHDSEGMEKDLANGETLSLKVVGDRFANALHGWVGCAGCHSDVDLDTHPADKSIASRGAFSAEASRICADCHAAADLADGPAHHARVAAASGMACSTCHDPHAVVPIAEWKAAIGETAYCLSCHGQALSVQLKSGERFALSVDPAVLRDSVHPDHECTDCHTGFTKQTHETMTFASTRELVIAQAAVCRECHEEKFKQYEGSIHATLIGSGNLAAPVCSDCHGSHAVRPKAVFETVAGVPCKKCHNDIFEAYVDSMHGKVRGILGHFEAPICADCHRAHEVDAAATGTQLRDACLGCHTGALRAHEDWLPNAALHLDAVSCPACHAPLAQRRVELRLIDTRAQVPLDEPQDARRFEGRIQSADAEGDGLDAVELWNLVRELNREGKTAEMTLQGRVGVRTGPDAHRLVDKGRAVRDCSSCHRKGAEAFQSVTVSIVGRDGRATHYSADKEVLSSLTSVNSVSGFYAIGGTRITLLDVLLALAFLAGISVPVGHLTLKWLFGKYLKRAQREGAPQDS